MQPEQGSQIDFNEHMFGATSIVVDGQGLKRTQSISILGAWSIWNHHNHCMFDGILPKPGSNVTC